VCITEGALPDIMPIICAMLGRPPPPIMPPNPPTVAASIQ
jgi:hypothetical protein